MLARLLTLAAAALPMVAAAGNWTALSYTQSVMMQVAAVGPSTAFISGGQNGAGANIIKTTDGGNTFVEENISNAFMFMATAAQSETSAIAAGIGLLSGSIQYSDDGLNFKNASEKNVAVEAAMSAYAIGGTDGNGYAVVGQWNVFGVNNSINGLAISQDAGATWSLVDTKCDPAISTRYASFPSPSTWFVTLGTFPNTSSVSGAAPITRNIHLHTEGKYAQLHFNEKSATPPSDDPAWWAQIMVTRDSGATFDLVFNNETFYFNQISCPSENVCYAVGENDAAAYAYKTADSGASWSLVFEGEGLSLMSVAAVSETEVYLGGGVMNFPVVGYSIYSADGGNTWTVNQIPDNYISSMSFGSATSGFATSLNTEQQSGILKFSA